MAVLTRVDIGGVDITSSHLIGYSFIPTDGDEITSGEIKVVKSITNSVTLSANLRVEIWRGFVTATDTKFFDGFIESYHVEGGMITLVVKDKLWQLVRREVTEFYDANVHASAGKISEIFIDLVETYGGLTADPTGVQDSGTVNTIARFVCNHDNVFERCQELADAIDWQFYYKASTDTVFFEPKGYTASATVLTVGTNVFEVPKWETDENQMANSVTVVGASQEVETTETGQIGVTSGYTTTGVTLTQEPVSVKVYSDVSNPPTTLKTGGVEGSTTATFFYSVDKDNAKILPRSGTTFTTNDYLQTNYSYLRPLPVRVRNSTSITTYGLSEKKIEFNDLKDIDDAELRGRAYLDKYGTPFTRTKLKVLPASTNDLNVGKIIQVVDNVSSPSVNDLFLINRMEFRYPGDYDELYVGDKEWRLAEWQSQVEKRLKRLFDREFENQDVIVEIVDVDNTVTPVVFKPKYQWITTRTITGTNIFMLGNSTYGVLGTGKLGDTDFGAETDNFILHYQNIAVVTFLDTDFKAGATTATWGTTGSVTFTSGQLAQSKSLDYNNGTITRARLTATIVSGSFTLQLSANGGSNWETVTNGTLYTFSNTGTDLRFKITENAASTGEISEVTVEDYH